LEDVFLHGGRSTDRVRFSIFGRIFRVDEMSKLFHECTPYWLENLYPESYKRMQAVRNAHYNVGCKSVEDAFKELTEEELEHYLMRQHFSESCFVLREALRRYNNKKDECEELRDAHNSVLEELNNKKNEWQNKQELKERLEKLREFAPRLTYWEGLFRLF